MAQKISQKSKSGTKKAQDQPSVKQMVEHLANLHQLQGQLLNKLQTQITKKSDNYYN